MSVEAAAQRSIPPAVARVLVVGALAAFAFVYYLAMLRWVGPWRPATWIYYFVEFPIRHAAELLLAGALVFVPLELLAKRHDKRLLRPGLVADVLHFSLTLILAALPIYFLATWVGYAKIDSAASVITAQPRWLQVVEALVFREFLVYWAHRITHMVPLLWRFHEVHHSSPDLDWLSAFRRHPVDALWMYFFLVVPLSLTGFYAVDIAFVALASEVWALYIHSNTKWRFHFLGPLVVTAEYHHWHHVRARSDHDKNYGEFTGVFDVLFGTYLLPEERQPGGYGTSGELPSDYVGQLVAPFRSRSASASGSGRLSTSIAGVEATTNS